MVQAWLLRQLPYILLFVSVIGAAIGTGFWLKEQGRKELRPVVERLESELAAERALRLRNEETLNAYQKELDALRNRPRPASPVRLCIPPPVSKPPKSTGSTDGPSSQNGSDAGQAGGGVVPGPDIGPELRQLAFDCDAENAKLRALQNWIKNK